MFFDTIEVLHTGGKLTVRFHEPVSGFTHLAGAVLAGAGMFWLITLTSDTPAKMISVIIYGVCMILCFSASAALHLPIVSDATRVWLNRIDHAAIYSMIAGTYTPLIYNVLTDDRLKWGSLWLIWTLALVGIIYKLFLYKNRLRLSTLMYVGMGWLGVFLLPHALQLMSPVAVMLVVAGGIVYSIGAVIFAIQKPNFHRHFGHHELWHLFVLAGCALHFVAVVMVL
jgi:hemolysin III